MTKLPTKLSALIRIAVADMEALQATEPNLVWAMEIWADRTSMPHTCLACVAGAVMLRTLKVEDMHGTSAHNAACLMAIDALRRGSIRGALQFTLQRMDNDVVHALMGKYVWLQDASRQLNDADTRTKFLQGMRNLAADLEAHQQ